MSLWHCILVLRLLMMLHAVTYGQMSIIHVCGHIANFLLVSLLKMLHSYILLILQSINFYKTCIVAVILSHTHLSVCSVLLTLRASPRATLPLPLIPFLLRLCLNNIKIYEMLSSENRICTYKTCEWQTFLQFPHLKCNFFIR